MSTGGWTKSILLGLCGVLAITSLTYYNDAILRGTYLVGNNMPVSVYGGMIIYMLTVNLALVLACRKLALNGAQMAVALGLTLAVCCIPGSGLMRTFQVSLIMPYHLEKTQAGWRESGVVQLAPKQMLVAIDYETDEPTAAPVAPASETPATDGAPTETSAAENSAAPASSPAAGGLMGYVAKELDPSLDRSENRVLGEYVSGWGKGREMTVTERVQKFVGWPRTDDMGVARKIWETLKFWDRPPPLPGEKVIPWAAWIPALSFWMPLILLIWVSLLGLSMVVHRQWSDYEHLPYPLVDFTNALLPQADGALAGVFKNRLFWLGMVPVIILYLNNYLVTINDNRGIAVNLSFEIRPILDALQLKNYGRLQTLSIYFTVVAFAFYLSPKVSFSVGISPFLWAIFSTMLARWGLQVDTGGYFTPNPKKFMVFGSYLGITAAVLYTGRHYYWSVLRRAFFVPTQQKVEKFAVTGMWLFLGGMLLSTYWIARVGLDWELALIYVGLLVMMFFVMSRIIAETGMFFIQVYWLPCGIVIGFFGAKALGPEAILILLLLSMVLAVDPREAFMPFIVNVLKLTDKQKVKLQPLSGLVVIMLIVGMLVAGYATLALQYRNGAPFVDVWATFLVPKMPFAEAHTYTTRLMEQGVIEEARSVRHFARFLAISPQEWGFVWWMLGGVAAVWICTAGRLNWTWWPLHPVCFLLWASMPAQAFGWSILLGWILKVLVMKYGGAGVFQRLKPLMFGLIAGELVGLVIPIISSIVWSWFATTQIPPFNVMPG